MWWQYATFELYCGLLFFISNVKVRLITDQNPAPHCRKGKRMTFSLFQLDCHCLKFCVVINLFQIYYGQITLFSRVHKITLYTLKSNHPL